MRERADSTRVMGEGAVWGLLWKFSLPCIVGMLVNALYNIVDRICIGYGVGEEGIAAVTVSLPLMMLMVAFSTLVGVGANTLFAIRMGEGRRRDTELILGNAFTLLVLFPAVASGVAIWGVDALLEAMGCSGQLLPLARPYAVIILAGSALSTTGHGLSHFLRSDGHPQSAMVAMLIGAGVNMALDPLFIFVFKWGVAGAAAATVIAQGCSFLWGLLYFLSPAANTRLMGNALRIRWRRIAGPFLVLGITPFALNVCFGLLNAVLNRSLQHYGGDQAIAVMGVLSAYMSLIFMPALGIGQGVPPLIGYNYGARKFGRVLEFYRASALLATLVMTAGWVLSQGFPEVIVRLFVADGSPLLGVAPRALRIYTSMFPLIGMPMMAGTLFQSIGKAWHAGFLSLSRQLIFFIPAMLLLPLVLPRLTGGGVSALDSVYCAAPVSDVISLAVAVVLTGRELRRMRRAAEEEEAAA